MLLIAFSVSQFCTQCLRFRAQGFLSVIVDHPWRGWSEASRVIYRSVAKVSHQVLGLSTETVHTALEQHMKSKYALAFDDESCCSIARAKAHQLQLEAA